MPATRAFPLFGAEEAGIEAEGDCAPVFVSTGAAADASRSSLPLIAACTTAAAAVVVAVAFVVVAVAAADNLTGLEETTGLEESVGDHV